MVAILKESKNKWEQRAPLAPKHVKRLVDQGIQVIVQPSSRRAFYDAEYKRAGATLQDDISAASLVMGVKVGWDLESSTILFSPMQRL